MDYKINSPPNSALPSLQYNEPKDNVSPRPEITKIPSAHNAHSVTNETAIRQSRVTDRSLPLHEKQVCGLNRSKDRGERSVVSSRDFRSARTMETERLHSPCLPLPLSKYVYPLRGTAVSACATRPCVRVLLQKTKPFPLATVP